MLTPPVSAGICSAPHSRPWCSVPVPRPPLATIPGSRLDRSDLLGTVAIGLSRVLAAHECHALSPAQRTEWRATKRIGRPKVPEPATERPQRPLRAGAGEERSGAVRPGTAACDRRAPARPRTRRAITQRVASRRSNRSVGSSWHPFVSASIPDICPAKDWAAGSLRTPECLKIGRHMKLRPWGTKEARRTVATNHPCGGMLDCEKC